MNKLVLSGKVSNYQTKNVFWDVRGGGVVHLKDIHNYLELKKYGDKNELLLLYAVTSGALENPEMFSCMQKLE